MTVEIGAVGLDLDFCHWVRGGVKKNEGERQRKMSVRGKRKKKKGVGQCVGPNFFSFLVENITE